ncbi:MAG: DNA polymerase III subunit delta [Candidatus Gastranaerophilales bacterium]|nr:DNA polymerase III subunit delta [Candidatus Gastranaerophilales bacterium]
MAVFLFYGQEDFLMDKEIKKLKGELLDSSFISMAYKMYDNPPFQTLLECVQSAPLMFGNTLTLIYYDKYLMGNKASLDDKQIEALDYAFTNMSPSVNIIFVCRISRDEYKKPDSRKKLYKVLSKHSQVREFAQYKGYDKTFPPVIVNLAKEKGLTISSKTVEFLIAQLGSNLTLIDSELEKLKTAIHPKTTIDEASIEKYCTSTDDIFALADCILKQDKNEIIRQYKLLTEKKHPLQIFAILQTNIRELFSIKLYSEQMGTSAIASKLKMNEFRVGIILKKLSNVSLQRLIEIKERLTEAEFKVKSSSQSEISETVLEMVLLS